MLDFDIDSNLYAGVSTPQGSLHFPELYDYEAARGELFNSPESAPLLGVTGDGDPIRVDFDSDSPHVLINAGSGGGKSVLARSIATQALCNGANVVFLDAKRHSHRWAKNLPGVHYAKTFSEIGDALVSVGMELHRRNEIVDSYPGDIEDAPVGPRIVVVFEEMNATMDALKGMSKRLPDSAYDAYDALKDIMFMGRAAKVHIVGIAQLATAEAMGGAAIRENFGTRILARYTSLTWNMLVKDCGQPQPSPDARGRGMVCRGGKARQTQFLYLSEEQAAALVRAAYEYRREHGLLREYSRRELRAQGRNAKGALTRATGKR